MFRFSLCLASLSILAVRGQYGYGGGGDDSSTLAVTSTSTSTPTSSASSSTGTSSAQQSLTGDTACGGTMCIAATLNGSETTYVLSSRGSQTFGWMGMGFGGQMSNTPMVIMWLNSNQVILSQREASSEVMPTVVANPPRTATFASSLSVLSTSKPELAFTIPSNSDTSQTVIFAFGTTDPKSSAVDAALVQHVDNGILKLDLTKQISSNTGSSTDSSSSIPLRGYQKLIVGHAVLCVVGFLFLLPAGALFARYARTFMNNWFQGHWILQFALAGPVILVGVILGIAAVAKAKAKHLDDSHKRWGIALLVLYLAQCALGAFIHFVKDANRKRRPPQNYVHAVVGITIIALALYQVHLGYDHEWQAATGRSALPSSVKTVFVIWAVLLPLSYALGLAFLPKQYRLERGKQVPSHDEYADINLRQRGLAG